jgi:hypothetical protein
MLIMIMEHYNYRNCISDSKFLYNLLYIDHNMITLASIIMHLIEGIAVVTAVYLVTKRSLSIRELIILVLTISVTFLILDLFTMGVAAGARQGTGFALGYTQIAGDGNTLPRQYYDPKYGQVVEGMDDPVALDYYGKYNPQKPVTTDKVPEEPNLIMTDKGAQTPSIILQEYAKSPFKTESYAPFSG